MIDWLLDQGGLAGDEEDSLDVLSDLVEKYEDARSTLELAVLPRRRIRSEVR
jgi:hypothetical protein